MLSFYMDALSRCICRWWLMLMVLSRIGELCGQSGGEAITSPALLTLTASLLAHVAAIEELADMLSPITCVMSMPPGATLAPPPQCATRRGDGI